MDEPLDLDDRIACASTQVAMETSTGVMTTRRLGEVVAAWADRGDGARVLAGVWSGVVEETS